MPDTSAHDENDAALLAGVPRRRLARPAAAVVAALAVIVVLLGWVLSGVTRVPMDRRAVAARFGVPVGVLQPGLHVGLPWPMGTARLVDNGAVHDVGLNDQSPAGRGASAGEAQDGAITLLVDGGPDVRQGVRSVSVDVRVLYRVGLDDADALRAAYAAVAPGALVRGAARHLVIGVFGAQSIDAVLDARPEALEATLRAGLQGELDRLGCGLTVLGVVIGAIRPPAGAGAAFATARAAAIAAAADVLAARHKAAALAARSKQDAYDRGSAARAAAYETVAGARTELVRFAADQQAARAGGASFRQERYLAALAGALAGAPKTIIDHRLNWPEAPVLDLRPLSAASAGSDGREAGGKGAAGKNTVGKSTGGKQE